MDPAILKGVGPVFSSVKKWICLQRVMERDSCRLDKLKATLPQKNSILTAIYVSEKNKTFQLGLIDYKDEFTAKPSSLQEIWESMVCFFFLIFKEKIGNLRGKYGKS